MIVPLASLVAASLLVGPQPLARPLLASPEQVASDMRVANPHESEVRTVVALKLLAAFERRILGDEAAALKYEDAVDALVPPEATRRADRCLNFYTGSAAFCREIGDRYLPSMWQLPRVDRQFSGSVHRIACGGAQRLPPGTRFSWPRPQDEAMWCTERSEQPSRPGAGPHRPTPEEMRCFRMLPRGVQDQIRREQARHPDRPMDPSALPADFQRCLAQQGRPGPGRGSTGAFPGGPGLGTAHPPPPAPGTEPAPTGPEARPGADPTASSGPGATVVPAPEQEPDPTAVDPTLPARPAAPKP